MYVITALGKGSNSFASVKAPEQTHSIFKMVDSCAIKNLNWKCMLSGTVIKAYDFRHKVSENNCTPQFYTPTGDPWKLY